MEDSTINSLLKSIGDDIEAAKFSDALIKISKHKNELPQDIFWLNKGIIEKKLSDYASSRYSLEMAKLEAPYNSRVYEELAEVKTLLNVGTIESATAPSDYLHQYFNFLPVSVYLTVFFIFYSILGLLTKMSGGAIRWLIFMGLGLLIFVSSRVYQNTYIISILPQDLLFKEGPSNVFSHTGSVPKGTKVVLLKEGEWYRIVYPSIFSGWTSEKQNQVLNEGF